MNLIEQFVSLDWDPYNPFDLQIGLFDNLRQHLTDDQVRELEKNCYQQYFEMLQKGEMRSAYYYKSLSRLIDPEHEQFFLEMAEEELEHGKMFCSLNNRLFGTGDRIDLEEQEFYRQGPWMGNDVTANLAVAYCIEVCIQAVVQALLDGSKTIAKKTFLQTFIEDESDHVQKFDGIIKKNLLALDDRQAQQVRAQFIKPIIERKCFAKRAVNTYLISINRSDLIELAYQNNRWHDCYLENLHKKLYPMAKSIDPTLTIEGFIDCTYASPVQTV